MKTLTIHAEQHTPSDSPQLTTPRGIKAEFSRRLYNYLRLKGWNQSELARRAGLKRDAISSYVRGESFPLPASLTALADALGIPTEELAPGAYVDTEQRTCGTVMELRQIQGDEGHVWLRVNRKVPYQVALRVLAAIEDAA